LTGLALLTKTTALALLPALACAAFLRREGRPNIKDWAAVLAPLILLPIGWWVRNTMLYGDPFAIRAFKEAFVQSPQASTWINGFGLPAYLTGWVSWWTFRSFLGAFGYMDIWLNESGLPVDGSPNTLYRVFGAITFVAFLGWLGSWKMFEKDRSNLVQIMNVAFVAVVALLFLQFNLQFFQAQARYLFPAVASIACGYSLGFLSLARDRWIPVLVAVVLFFGGVTVYAGIRLPVEFQKRIAG
jgi:hypothetical protein